jgi:hypothetical protein
VQSRIVQPPSGSTSRHRRRGQSIAELIFVVPLLVMMVAGLTDLSNVLRTKLRLASAAEVGLLYASLNKTSAEDTGGIEQRVLEALRQVPDTSGDTPGQGQGQGQGHEPKVEVELSAPDGDGFGRQQVTVIVSVDIPVQFTVPGLPSVYTVTEAASGRVMSIEMPS